MRPALLTTEIQWDYCYVGKSTIHAVGASLICKGFARMRNKCIEALLPHWLLLTRRCNPKMCSRVPFRAIFHEAESNQTFAGGGNRLLGGTGRPAQHAARFF